MERDESGDVVLTVGRWPWRLASGKKRVTTYLPNCVLEKMDGEELWPDAAAVVLSKRVSVFC